MEDETILKVGLVGQDDCYAKYQEILGELKALRASVKDEGFVALGLAFLEAVYGRTPGPNGFLLRFYFNQFQKDQKTGDVALLEKLRGLFFARLDPEIESFERLAKLNQEKEGRLTEPMKDAQLLAGQQDLEKIMRYEAALERHFERKLQQLVSWRREKREGGEKEGPHGLAGRQDEGLP